MSSSHSSTSALQPSSEQIERVTRQIRQVRDRISKATKESKRQEEPRLVAISKLHPPTSILAAHVHADQVHFGENYAQELEAKAKVLPETIKWHFVGKLQSNKAKLIAGIPNLYMLETLDSVKCATALEKALDGKVGEARKEPLGVYLQVNTSGEEAKGGMEPLLEEASSKSSDLFALAKHVILECPSLRLRGVMTIGAASNSKAGDEQSKEGQSRQEIEKEAQKTNPDFARLSDTRTNLVTALRSEDTISEKHKETYADLLQGDDERGGLELSMGMSNDLEVGIKAGSNNVRVGTDCFGVRPPSREEAMEGMKEELAG
ncbi:hypothetical protein CBS101457_003584 [Exobasidium rhododendri]|nr:hypothetical protein CBS101457_003584 [Exobasidium rhododendri]